MRSRQEASSFRDPAAHIFTHDGTVYRQVNKSAKSDFDAFISSGLYSKLQTQKLIIEHEEVNRLSGLPESGLRYKILLPEQIEQISYPYEWCFSQMKDAALLTLDVQTEALKHGLVLKDASAYNVQFLGGRPVFIDTTSFEIYDGQPTWVAYKQFCQHFLAPLALMAYVDLRLNSLLKDNIDGVPLDLAAKLMPGRRRLKVGLLIHLWLHASAQRRYAKSPQKRRPIGAKNDLTKLLGQADSLRRTVSAINLNPKLQTEWGNYYSFTNYEKKSFEQKQKIIAGYIEKLKPDSVWDLGGNDGTFSRVALKSGAKSVTCLDIDPLAVEKNYRLLKEGGSQALLPLVFDLINPSPAIGWSNGERLSLQERVPPSNTVLAVALIHHLAISNNLPLNMIADFFAKLGQNLIIEFVPKSDSKVKQLLNSRKDIFDQYNAAEFEKSFGQYYEIDQKDPISGSDRVLYLMKLKPT